MSNILTSNESIKSINPFEIDLRLAAQLIETLSMANEKEDLIAHILFLMKEYTGCEAAGIRLKENGNFPFYKTSGFSSLFVDIENDLWSRDQNGKIILDTEGNPCLEGLCGDVLCGRIIPEFPYFTENGSFWTGSTTEFLASTADRICQKIYRNQCNRMGYESLALIPLKTESEIVGLLQLNDRRKDIFTRDMIEYLEKLSPGIVIGFQYNKAIETLKWFENQYNSLFDLTHEAIFISDAKTGTILDVNGKAEQLSGRTKKEIIGIQQMELHPSYLADYYEDKFRYHVQKGRILDMEAEVMKSDGSIVPVSINAAIIRTNGRKVIQAVFRDISNEKRILELKTEIEGQKLVEKAKVILMDRYKISEKEARKRLQQESRRQRKKMKELSEVVISSQSIM